MLKEKKYRIWDVQANSYVKQYKDLSEQEEFEGKFYAIYEDGNLYEIYTNKNGLYGFSAMGENGAIVEEYIGIEDMYGKEACEGDIVKYTHGFYGEVKSDSGAVAYDPSTARYYVSDFWVPYLDDPNDCFGEFMLYSGNTLEIIGNIHENPELIKEK